MPGAVSFELRGNQPGDVRGPLENAVAELKGHVGGGVVFLCGTMARQILEVATVIKSLRLDARVLVASGAGVLTERGEHEQTSACVGLLWQAGRCDHVAVDQRGDEPISARLAKATRRVATQGSPVALFASRETINPTDLFDDRTPIDLPVFGGGTLGKPGAMVVSARRIVSADVVGLVLQGAGRAVVRASPACQILGRPQPVTATDGALVLSIASKPALDVLRSQASEVAGQRPVVLAVDLGHDVSAHPRLMLRGIRGIHEARGGVMVSEDIQVGTRVAFAVLDGAAAAADMEATLRDMGRDVRGGMPRFGIFIDCAGRGSQLYGEAGVDLQALRRRFPKLPIAGVTSAFEIGPGMSGATTHLYSGVFCLVYAPS